MVSTGREVSNVTGKRGGFGRQEGDDGGVMERERG